MPTFRPIASGHARQLNIAGDNYGPVLLASGRPVETAIRQLPADISDFTGRETELAELSQFALAPRPGPAVLCLFGPPGVGKSALALRLAHCLAPQIDEVQIYIDVGEAGIDLSAREILAQLVASFTPDLTAVSFSELRARFQSRFGGTACLIVLDNVREVSQVRTLIPNSPQAVVIMTSRTALAALGGVRLYRVDVLQPAEARELFQTVSGRERCDEIDKVVGLCGYLPLAVRIAAAIAKKRRHWSMARLVKKLSNERTRLDVLQEGDLNVRASLELSYRHLQLVEQRALRLSVLVPTPEFLATDIAILLGCSVDKADDALDGLVDAQLVESVDDGQYRRHDLLTLFAREMCERAETSAADAADRLLKILEIEFVDRYRTILSTGQWVVSELIEGWAMPKQVDTEALYVEQRVLPAAGHTLNWQEMVDRAPYALVFGGAGSGKSTLAERACQELARSPKAERRIGITVPLRRYAGEPIESWIVAAIQNRFELRFSIPVLERVLRRFQVVLFLDSIDELPQEERERCTAAIEIFCVDHPSVAIVVTSRPDLHLRETGIAGFAAYDLAPFSADDAIRFARAWLPDGHFDEVVTHLNSTGEGSWSRNPLLLTWAMASYIRTGWLCVDELDVHQATFEMTLGSRETYRQIQRTVAVTANEVASAVLHLAYWLKSDRHRVSGTSQSALIRELGSKLTPIADSEYSGIDHAEEVLSILVDRFGILYRADTDNAGEPIISIVQDTFGEYLAARNLVNMGAAASELSEKIITMVAAGRADRGWWYTVELVGQLLDGSQKQDLLHALQLNAAKYSGPGLEHVNRMLQNLAP